MEARALVCNEAREFSIEAVVLPDPGRDQILIRNYYSGVSIGTEFALIRNKISWGPFPICTGYMGTGVVEAVGADVRGFAAGDRVYYRRNESMTLAADGTPVTNAAGVHCSHVVLEPSGAYGADPLPPDADMAVCSMFVMPAVGLHGVNLVNPRLGETVVVYGCGLIGLGVVAACANRGCEVIAVEIDEERLRLARGFGADHLIDGAARDVEAEVKKIAPDGADAVIECTGIPECIDRALPLCRRYGKFCWQGNYGDARIPFNYQAAAGPKLRMFFPSDDGLRPCRRAIVKSMTNGMLPWVRCITHRIAAAAAPELYRRIDAGDTHGIAGVVIGWLE
jgi:2-desacetyl-2-hydroxyethyl bacteriochlorophyllide A dehydrogenase